MNVRRVYVCCRYVLKSQMKELLELEAKNAKSIEEEIEEERQKVDAKTPITETVCTLCPCIIFMRQNLQLKTVTEMLPAALVSCWGSSAVGQECS